MRHDKRHLLLRNHVKSAMTEGLYCFWLKVTGKMLFWRHEEIILNKKTWQLLIYYLFTSIYHNKLATIVLWVLPGCIRMLRKWQCHDLMRMWRSVTECGSSLFKWSLRQCLGVKCAQYVGLSHQKCSPPNGSQCMVD